MVKMKTTSAIRFYRQAIGGFLTICTPESVQTQRLAEKKMYFPHVRNSLQSEVCINHLGVIVVIWKSSVFCIVLLSFRSAIPYLLPNIGRMSLFCHKNIVCLIKKASVFVNESKTAVCLLFSKHYRVVFSTPPLYDVPCYCSFVEWMKERGQCATVCD